MNLHNDKLSFNTLIDTISKVSNLRPDIIEKDYYVCLLLKELSSRPEQSYAYFKGGTALYMSLDSFNRFSEDIDLTVNLASCKSKNEEKQRLKKAVLKFNSLIRIDPPDDTKGSITCSYGYDPIYKNDEDPLQRFGRVKIEGTSFTVSEPTCIIQISPCLYKFASDDFKKILREKYSVEPFSIISICLERIFVDKLFAAEFYYERKEYFDVSKHIYDICFLLENEEIKSLVKNKQYLNELIGLKRLEESRRKGGVSENLLIKNFSYFNDLTNDNDFLIQFEAMQKIYVFDNKNRISKELIDLSLKTLKNIFIRYDF